MSATFLPNTFMSFNAYVDVAMELLTPEEYVTLSFAARHILGWQEKINRRQGFISLTMFEHGYTAENGTHFGGTGLSRPTLLKTLKELTHARLLVRVGATRGPDGQQWELGEAGIDWDYLRSRKAQRDEANRERTAKARNKRAKRSTGQSDKPAVVNATYQPAVNAINPSVVNATNHQRLVTLTDTGLSDKPKQNHLQNQVVVVEQITTTTTEIVRAQNPELPQAAVTAWSAAYVQFEAQLDRATFDAWVRGATLLAVEVDADGREVFVIGTRSEFAREVLEQRLYRTLARILSDTSGQSPLLRFEVQNASAKPDADADENPLFRLLAEQADPTSATPPATETIRSLFERFISPVNEANEASVSALEQRYSPDMFGYALTMMADKQAQGKVKDPLSYTLGILRNQGA